LEMTTHTIDWIPNERIMYGRVFSGYDVRRDTPAASRRMVELLQAADRPVPYILDLTELGISFSELMDGMSRLNRSEVGAFVRPKLAELIVVSEQTVIRLSADALMQAKLGVRQAQMFATAGDALAYARQKYGTKSYL
jgi:hypothetical protein